MENSCPHQHCLKKESIIKWSRRGCGGRRVLGSVKKQFESFDMGDSSPAVVRVLLSSYGDPGGTMQPRRFPAKRQVIPRRKLRLMCPKDNVHILFTMYHNINLGVLFKYFVELTVSTRMISGSSLKTSVELRQRLACLYTLTTGTPFWGPLNLNLV